MLVQSSLYLLSFLTWYVSGHGPHHPRSSHRHQHPQPSTNADGAIKLTQDTQLLQDKEHIKEDLQEIVSPEVTENMSPEELEFYYFKIHDADNNTKLDGLEILRAVQHTSHEHDDEPEGQPVDEAEDFNRIVDLIDRVLTEDDLDNDGYLSYIEYVRGRDREEKQKETSSSSKINYRY